MTGVWRHTMMAAILTVPFLDAAGAADSQHEQSLTGDVSQTQALSVPKRRTLDPQVFASGSIRHVWHVPYRGKSLGRIVRVYDNGPTAKRLNDHYYFFCPAQGDDSSSPNQEADACYQLWGNDFVVRDNPEGEITGINGTFRLSSENPYEAMYVAGNLDQKLTLRCPPATDMVLQPVDQIERDNVAHAFVDGAITAKALPDIYTGSPEAFFFSYEGAPWRVLLVARNINDPDDMAGVITTSQGLSDPSVPAEYVSVGRLSNDSRKATYVFSDGDFTIVYDKGVRPFGQFYLFDTENARMERLDGMAESIAGVYDIKHLAKRFLPSPDISHDLKAKSPCAAIERRPEIN